MEYDYGPWGEPLSVTGTMASTLGRLQPFRYRGYVYDEETGLYYLKTRYYNPKWGRFICPDKVSLLTAEKALPRKNLFVYCENNPIKNADSDGTWSFLAALGKIAVGMAQQYVGDVIGNAIHGKKGWDLLTPTSSIGEYVAAGVSALIPGGKMSAYYLRNACYEQICVYEKMLKGEPLDAKYFGGMVLRVVVYSTADFVLGKAADAVLTKLLPPVGTKVRIFGSSYTVTGRYHRLATKPLTRTLDGAVTAVTETIHTIYEDLDPTRAQIARMLRIG